MSPPVGSSSSWRCRTTVKQLHGSSHHVSTANELDYISPPEACSVKILLWKAADQIFSNSTGKPTPSVFSALTFCPCRQCRTLCRSGWIVCVGSKAAVSIWCPHILRMWHLLIGQYRPSHFSILMARSPCRSQCNAQQTSNTTISMSSPRTIATWQPSSAPG